MTQLWINHKKFKRAITEEWQKRILDGEDIFNLTSGHPDFSLLDKRDSLGATPLHYACASATTAQFELLFAHIPAAYWEINDNNGRNFLFYIVYANNQDGVEFVLSDKLPAPLKPLLLKKDEYERNFFHHIALSNSLTAIKFILSDRLPKKFENQLFEKDILDNNLFHLIVPVKNLAVIEFILSDKLPQKFERLLFEKIHTYGLNFFHYIAEFCDLSAIKLVLSDKLPKQFERLLFEKTTIYEFNFFHLIALRGKQDIIEFVLSDQLPRKFMPLLSEKNNRGNTFLHCLVSSISGNKASIISSITHLLRYNPQLAHSLWVKNNDGDSLDALAIKSKMQTTPTTILKNVIYEALVRIIENPGAVSHPDQQLLFYFHERVNSIDKTIKIIDGLKTLQKKNALKEIDIAKIITILSPPGERDRLFTKTNPLHNFLLQLRGINRALKADRSDKTTHDAAIIFKLLLQNQKYIDTLLADEKLIFFTLSSIFSNTDEVSALMPKVVEQRGIDMAESDFDTKLNAIECEIKKICSGDEADSAIMVLNGVRYLFHHFELINAFAISHPGKLYYLDKPDENLLEEQKGKLPFHVDQYDHGDTLRSALIRIVREYIAAFDISKEAGRTKNFFEKSITGFCLDARIGDLVTWAAMFSGLESIDSLMKNYIDEYLAYQKIIEGINDFEKLQCIEPALQFVMHYHQGELYKTDEGAEEITAETIEAYLSDIMCYTHKKVENGCCSIM